MRSERNGDTEAIEVRLLAVETAEIGERASEVGERNVVTAVSEHFKEGAARVVEPRALHTAFVNGTRNAMMASDDASVAGHDLNRKMKETDEELYLKMKLLLVIENIFVSFCDTTTNLTIRSGVEPTLLLSTTAPPGRRRSVVALVSITVQYLLWKDRVYLWRLVVACTSMASSNPFFDDIRSKSDVDPPSNEEPMDISELVNDPTQTALKSNMTVTSSVRELLECPVCLNAMYPPIHQVVYIFDIALLISWIL
ncbi:E3 ubiquitin-protein ligase SINAT5 [Senna tora]|uniref:E3 ubiquitin-protein ligase SINAT5 n=1 Tax=Senna tora TaxID=362788 RepID=A0A835CC07_9FABA|nr:E3 ubiquitin-protein ligase SINAT5 [Senna tora]